MPGTYPRCTQSRRDSRITHKRVLFILAERRERNDDKESYHAQTKINVNMGF